MFNSLKLNYEILPARACINFFFFLNINILGITANWQMTVGYKKAL